MTAKRLRSLPPGSDYNQSDVANPELREATEEELAAAEPIEFSQEISDAIEAQATEISDAIIAAVSRRTYEKTMETLQAGQLGSTFAAKFKRLQLTFADSIKLQPKQIYQVEGEDTQGKRYLESSPEESNY